MADIYEVGFTYLFLEIDFWRLLIKFSVYEGLIKD